MDFKVERNDITKMAVISSHTTLLWRNHWIETIKDVFASCF